MKLWNYLFFQTINFQALSSNLRSQSYFQIERNCRPDNYIEPFIGLKLQINILHLNN